MTDILHTVPEISMRWFVVIVAKFQIKISRSAPPDAISSASFGAPNDDAGNKQRAQTGPSCLGSRCMSAPPTVAVPLNKVISLPSTAPMVNWACIDDTQKKKALKKDWMFMISVLLLSDRWSLSKWKLLTQRKNTNTFRKGACLGQATVLHFRF